MSKIATINHQRALGQLNFAVDLINGKSALKDLRQMGCFRALFPRCPLDEVLAVCLNTSGGVTGGDELSLSAVAANSSTFTLTTQAAERIYRSVSSQSAKITVDLTLTGGATLNWLPQETILFNGSNLRRSITVNMERSTRLLMVEPLIFGRHAMGEELTSAYLVDHWTVHRDGKPVFADRTFLQGNIHQELQSTAVGQGAGATAGFLLVCDDAEKHLKPIRELLPETAGVSLIRDGVLFGRILARDGFDLRRSLVPVLTRLNESPLPKTWTL